MGLSARYMQSAHGVASDGMVPVDSAVLPGSAVVRNEMDHSGPAMQAPFAPGNVPGDTIQALLTLALERASALEAQEGPEPGTPDPAPR